MDTSTMMIKLTRVCANNYSLLRDVDVELAPGLTIITGGSGAGKSLLFDAVAFALGEQSQRGVLGSAGSQCEVRLEFEIAGTLAASLGTPWREGHNQLVRRLYGSGRTRLEVNGQQASIELVQASVAPCIEIAGQFESQVLFNPVRHLGILDSFTSDEFSAIFKEYSEKYASLLSLRSRLKLRNTESAQRAFEIEQLEQHISELAAAAIEPGEHERVAAELKLQENAKEIAAAAFHAANLLDGTEEQSGAYDLLAGAHEKIADIQRLMDGADPQGYDLGHLAELAGGAMEAAREVALELRGMQDVLQFDAQRETQLAERMDVIHRLERKYAAHSDSFCELLEDKRTRLGHLTDDSQSPEQLQADIARLETEMARLAKRLTELRHDAAENLGRLAARYFHKLAFPYVELLIDITTTGEFSAQGCDVVEFLVTLNPGEPARPLARVASGGEASRLMLGLKAALAERLDHGVMLLDEIEAGLGGDVAYKVARVFAELAEHRQVVAITHLPVVAANSQHHLVSRKETDSQQTQVVYEPVAAEARRRELHRMVGDTGSEAGLAFVDELLAEGQ